MADVKYDFAADVTAAERAIAQLERKQEQLEAKMKQGHRTSKKGQDDFVAGASKMVSGLVSVTAAVATVTRAYGQWQERIAQLRQEQERFNDALLEGLVGAGQLAAGQTIRHTVRNIPGVTQEQAQAVFDGIMAGAPDLNPAQARRATEDFARLAPLFSTFDEQGNLQGAEQLKAVSQLRGRMQQLAPGLSADDVTDLTLALQQNLGGRAGQAVSGGAQQLINQLTDQGLSIDRALAVVTEASREGLELGTLRGVVGKGSAEGLTLDQLLAMDPGQRRELLGQEQFQAFARLDKADIEALTKQYAQARTGDLAADELARARQQFPGRFVEQKTRVDQQRADRADAAHEDALDKLTDRRYQQVTQKVPFLRDLPGLRLGLEMVERLAQIENAPLGLGRTPQEQVARMAAEDAIAPSQRVDVGPRSIQEFLQQTVRDPLRSSAQEHFIGPARGVIENTRRELGLKKQDETNRLLQEIAENTRTLSAQRQPNRVNRDAHTEGVPAGGTAGF